jgi:hypothetical protein
MIDCTILAYPSQEEASQVAKSDLSLPPFSKSLTETLAIQRENTVHWNASYKKKSFFNLMSE